MNDKTESNLNDEIDLSRVIASLPLLRHYADRREGELPQEVEDRIREHDDG